MASWFLHRSKNDQRKGRLVFLIECITNQNARDMGAAERPACIREVVDVLAKAEIGMVQIPCPEIACLGFERQRADGQSIRDAMETPEATTCCQSLALETAEKIQSYVDQGFEVLAILGGNEQSPGCAVHPVDAGGAHLKTNSGVFMKMLATELSERGLEIPFHAMRDADPKALKKDLDWLLSVC